MWHFYHETVHVLVCSQVSSKSRVRALLWKRSLHYLCWIRSGASAIHPLTNPRQLQTRLASGHPSTQVSGAEKAKLLIGKLDKILYSLESKKHSQKLATR